MAALKIYAYLVHPGKNTNPQPTINGNKLPASGKLFDMLSGIFHANPADKDFEIMFRRDQDGRQHNNCRNMMIDFATNPTKSKGMAIAERLRNVTDRRPGIGLLFLMAGQHGVKQRLVVSRFPANEAILAEVARNSLDVSYLERVFIKRMTAYKAVMLEHKKPASAFWAGVATDRQAGSRPDQISDYWLDDFLTADFAETPEAGTRRLAEALRAAVKESPLVSVKDEIAAAITLAPRALSGQQVSIESFCSHFALSQTAQDTIRARLEKPSLASKIFRFDPAEFQKRLPYRTVQMDSGAILTAPTGDFEDVFQKTVKPNGEIEFSTTGRVSDERIAKR